MHYAHDPFALSQRFFEINQRFSLIERKIRVYYKAILIETTSVDFSHSLKGNSPRDSLLAFSKAFVHKI